VNILGAMMENTISNRFSFGESLFQLDRILRGDATRPELLKRAEIEIPVVGVSVTVICLAVIYGACMGVFAMVRGVEQAQYAQAVLQTFASMCKVPLLFLLTLIVTFPSLYVFNAIAGTRLRMLPVLKLLIASLAVNLAVLSSMGPIVAFFSVSTPNYGFIVLLNVAVFALAGCLGLGFLIKTMGRLDNVDDVRLPSKAPELSESSKFKSQKPPGYYGDVPVAPPVVKTKTKSKSGPLDGPPLGRLANHVWRVFYCWLAVFCLVGCQMGWVLRPFIGSPNMPFQWFRVRNSNFFEAVIGLIFSLFTGGGS